MSKSREQLNDYLKKIDITGKVVLDIGVQDKPTSGLAKGEFGRYLTMDIDPQWSADIIGDINEDPTKWNWEKADKNKDTLGTEDFDVIFCIEVLEHCWNPVQSVQNMANLCKPGGTVYISTPFINPHHDYYDYLRYTNEWFRDVLPKVGFKEVIIKERVATIGLPLLQGFYKMEGLKFSKIRPEYGNYTYPIGYFVEARK